MSIKAIVVDLDGTLLNSSKQVSERSCAALQHAHKKGIKIIVATARPPRSVAWLLPQKLQDISSFVYYNGAMIHCSNTGFAYHQTIDSSVSAQILQHILSEQHADISFEVADQWFALRQFDPAVIQAVRGEPIIKTLKELQELSPSKIIASGLRDWQGLIKAWSDKVSILVTDRGQLVQISHLQASKESGVQRLCEVYSIRMNEIIAFGDDTNDIGLVAACGHGVAMGNAVAELKQIADEITSSNDEDGVAIVVERLLNNYLLTKQYL